MSALYSILAIGLTVIFGILRIFNIAHGSFMVTAGYVTFWLFALYGIDPLASLPFCFALFVLIGWITQKTLIGPAIVHEKYTLQSSLLVTYGLALIIENASIIAWSGNYRTIITDYSFTSLTTMGLSLNVPRLLTLVVALTVMITFYLFISRTGLGKAIRACTQDRDAALLVGIDFDRIASITFGLCTGVAAVAGALLVLTDLVHPSMALQYTLKAFTIIVLGGLGSIPGALLGSLVLGLSEALGGFLFVPAYKEVISFVILIVALVIRPEGFLGKKR
jgi:branched-chain amino acid transport system permease protein